MPPHMNRSSGMLTCMSREINFIRRRFQVKASGTNQRMVLCQGDRAMSFPLEEHSVLTSSLVEEGRVEGILIPKKMKLAIPPTPLRRRGRWRDLRRRGAVFTQGLRMKSIKFGNILIYKWFCLSPGGRDRFFKRSVRKIREGGWWKNSEKILLFLFPKVKFVTLLM